MFAKIFRNTLIASTLLVGASIFASPSAMAEDPAPVVTDPGTVSGTIAAVSELTYAAPSSTALTAGNFGMGNLDITNNDPQGWTLAVTSGNGGQLEHASVVTASVTYTGLTVAHNDLVATSAALDLTPASPTGTLVTEDYNPAAAAGLTNVAVSATMGAVGAELPAGTYSDTLTFTLTCR